MIKAICTDFGGVLFPIQPYQEKPSKEHLSIIKSVVIGICSSRDSEIENNEYTIEAFKSDLELVKSKEYDIDLIYQSIVLENSDYLELLNELSEKYKIYALVNEAPKWTELRLYFNKKLHFNDIFISAYIGYQKPSREAYKYLLERIKLKANEVLFIDDDSDNIISAKDMGFETIKFDNNQQTFNEIEAKLQR